ncbi:helix-turn-helix transcriptional regulator [Mycolicibacterium baixiangningiae]|uniref:helix-turn-helix transcriptional regulator n=1 Tax=Mycolicibacterium baixiangningiae TaxID=2761578 RepID=UPI001867525D|nr:helix-turn-helix transcriptional regulator [Mycolicibacterium baixiangningiae]
MEAEIHSLGSFLRSRRERVDPAAAGVVLLGRRRVPGLRREELATLAGVSATYYARLEQGRDRHPSPEVLDAIADALRLDTAERDHLHRLGSPASRRATRGRPMAEAVRPGVSELLALWSAFPAFVVNARRDVLAATELAERINPGWSPGCNLAVFTFLDARAKETYPDWDIIAGQVVAGLRTASAAYPDGDVGGLIEYLTTEDATFAKLWSTQDVYARTIGQKRFAVKDFGVITLQFEAFSVDGAPGQTLFVYFPSRGSSDESVFAHLQARAYS